MDFYCYSYSIGEMVAFVKGYILDWSIEGSEMNDEETLLPLSNSASASISERASDILAGYWGSMASIFGGSLSL